MLMFVFMFLLVGVVIYIAMVVCVVTSSKVLFGQEDQARANKLQFIVVRPVSIDQEIKLLVEEITQVVGPMKPEIVRLGQGDRDAGYTARRLQYNFSNPIHTPIDGSEANALRHWDDTNDLIGAVRRHHTPGKLVVVVPNSEAVFGLVFPTMYVGGSLGLMAPMYHMTLEPNQRKLSLV